MAFETTAEKFERRLNEEKGYLWNDVNELKAKIDEIIASVEDVKKSAPEHFKELKGATKAASYYKNRAEEQHQSIQDLKGNIESE
ncbi:hypothetical protein [Vibrio coralliilyticus]|uniref:hypothetical protein n=1 Tax=Vibrio coralliilyticus TaxID=190893 RepID=UPI001E5A678B|nr:hypothetical protein [Vibrio coralliilyticus]MCC2525077.1 hypothetical protein [Vibrio coralliilyticus]